jgi:DNA-binding CsgD family transcriptional regulator
MRLVAPHVRRAVLIGKVIDLKEAQATAFAQTLDGLRAATFLVDGDARVMHANTAGHALLAESDMLRAVGGRLASGDARTDATLREIFQAARNGDVALGAKGIAVPLAARDGTPHVAHVLPLTAGQRRRPGARHAAVAAVFVHKAAFETPSLPETIASTYRLTLAELRVLFAIVEVGGVPEVAEVLGIAASTVKTHLGHVYQKTGLARQADLVKLVAGFSTPLRG